MAEKTNYQTYYLLPLTSYLREAVLVVDCINSDGYVFFQTSGDVAVLRLYNPSELMKRTTSGLSPAVLMTYCPVLLRGLWLLDWGFQPQADVRENLSYLMGQTTSS